MSALDAFTGFVEILTHPLGAAALAVGIVAATAHYGYDRAMYNGEYTRLKDAFATSAAQACGHDSNKNNIRLYETVHRDVSRLRNNFAWLPTGQVVDALTTAKNHNIVLYPMTLTQSFRAGGNGVTGVLYNDGQTPPVFVYRDLSRAQLDQVTDRLGANQALPEGALVVRLNNATDTYEFTQLPPGENTLPINNGTATVTIGANPCRPAAPEGLGVKEKVKDWLKDKIGDIRDRAPQP